MTNNSRLQKMWLTLKPYWDISFHFSRSYKIVMVALAVIYFLSYVVISRAVFKTEHPQFVFSLAYVSIVNTLLFLGSCHFFIRPYLKLKFLPQPRFGWNILHFIIYSFALGIIICATAFYLIKASPFEAIDFSNITFKNAQGDQRDMMLTMGEPELIFFSAINQILFYWMWALPYVFWHTLVSKKQIQQQMREAQLQQLTNQLNPHFLFNSLNSIRALIFEDQEKAAYTLTQLSELFRVHLQAHLKPLSTLEDEWQIAKRYLEIEQVRLESRLELNVNFDNSLWQKPLPTLSLLTLVENAIKHGISPSEQTGFVEITSVRIKPDRWQLKIANSVAANSREKSTHTGLSNLKQRLQLLSPLHQLDYQKTNNRFELTMEMVDDQNPHR